MQLSPLLLEKIEVAKQEGRQEGETIGEARMVVRLLDRRFGKVSTQLVARIQQLTLPQLEELGEALLDFADIAELEAWLIQH
jgi:predicted transposase YdaD